MPKLRLLLFATLVAGPAVAADPPREVKGWGVVTDPDADCAVKLVKDALSVTVPGEPHDLHPAIEQNAPRVLRNVEGDFTATVAVGNVKPGAKPARDGGIAFASAGLLVWHDEDNFVRLERNSWRTDRPAKILGFPPLLEQNAAGEYTVHSPPAVPAAEFSRDKPTHLRLARAKNKLAASVSHDGKKWAAVKTLTVDMPARVSVGVAVVNVSDAPVTATFTGFKVTTSD